MIKKGFTILEVTFSIAILAIAISFGGYLINKSISLQNKFKLMNLAYIEHQSALNLTLNLLETNSLRFPSHYDGCKLTSLDTENFNACENLSIFGIDKSLNLTDYNNGNGNGNVDNIQTILDSPATYLPPAYCQDEECSFIDSTSVGDVSRSYPIYSVLHYDVANDEGPILNVFSFYTYEGKDYKIESNLKI